MSHPDEGTIQMLLDGELDAAERRRVEDHVEACASCAARLAEAREFSEEADRLVGVLEVPRREPARRAVPRHRASVRGLAWAASIVIAVGIGYWSRGMPGGAGETVSPRDGAVAVAVTPPAVEPASPATDERDTAAPPVRSAAEPVVRQGADLRDAPAEAKAVDAAKESGRARNEVAATPPASPGPGPGFAVPGPTQANEARTADDSTPAWRVIAMEEAVRLLEGQIRLIDGLTPDRVETGPGTAVAGADPTRPLVRVVYSGGAVILDQQRPQARDLLRQQGAAKAIARADGAAQATTWQEEGGARFVVTGTVSTDSLRALAERVR